MKKKKNIFEDISPEILKKRKKTPEPIFIQPMLATLTKDYFSRKDWIYEHKFDGERCLVFKKNGKVRLVSRDDKNMNDEYPELVRAFSKQTADNFIIDGEIIALNKKMNSDFQLLQSRINLREMEKIKEREKEIHIQYCIFDLMYIDGYDIRKFPLYLRKKLLKTLLSYNKILIYTEHKIDDAIKFFKEACKLGWEGLIAKKFDSEYVGIRSRDWLKFKCIMKQELVIGGYTDPKNSRKYFGALLVGYYKNEKFIYAGKVGTGYTQDILKLLGNKLKKIEIKKCPFSNYDESEKGIHWVKPLIVAEFQFANWTKQNKLRVGRYKGLRNDKKAKDVVQEIPKPIGPG